MHRCGRIGALVLGVSAAVLPVTAATAAGRPQRGWVVDGKARFEPIGPGAAPLTVAGVGSYRGAIEVTRAGTVVNDVPLEDYVKGVAEVPATWPLEVLKAQAIAARTYALYEMLHKVSVAGSAPASRIDAHICATQDCQVYAGYRKEHDAPQWAAAVDATRGQTLLYRGGPILAMYSSSNGGASVSGSQPYLRAVRDPDDAAVSPTSHWRYALPLAQVGSAFGQPGTTFDVGRAGDSVILTSRLDDGTQQQQSVPVAAFRDRVNAVIPPPNGLPRTIPSLRFTVETNGDGVVIDGHGFGHGIGLSQFGALGKALRGMKAPDILASYYSGLRPVPLQPQQLPATIRVEVADGRGDTAISGRFRVLDGAGHRLAVTATGTWHVVPAAKGKVRVVPPAGADQPLVLQPVRYDAAQRGLRVRVNLPTDVQATINGASMPSAILDTGDHLITLPALSPGAYTIDVAADAGAGRVAAQRLDVVVADPSTLHTQDRTPPRTVVEAMAVPVRAAARTTLPVPIAVVAFVLAAVVGTTSGALYRSRRSRSS